MTLVSLAGVNAAEEAGTKGKKKAQAGANHPVFNILKDVELTEEQKEKVAAIKAEHGPKLAELQKKQDSILTPEQVAARKEALAKVKSDNLKGKERQAAIDTALSLTPEQKEKWTAAQGELREAQGKVRAKFSEFLTEEQKAKVPELSAKKGKKKKNAD